MYRIKYRLDDPKVYKGFKMIADGIGGRSRFKHALAYFNQNGFPNMKYANLYQTYRHALKRSKPLAMADNKYQNKVNQDRELKYKHRLDYQKNRRLAKKHFYTQSLDKIQTLRQNISKSSNLINQLKMIIKNKNNQIQKLVNYNNQLNNQLNMYKGYNGQVPNNMGQNGYYNSNPQQRTRVTSSNPQNFHAQQPKYNPNNRPIWKK